MKSLALWTFLLPLSLASDDAAKGPAVGKVVTLLNDLQARINADDQSDEKAFNKYMCWCDEVSAQKKKMIDQATKSLQTLALQIEKNTAQKETLQTKIKNIADDKQATNQSKAAAKAAYNSSHQASLVKQNQTQQVINSLTTAIFGLGSASKLLQTSSIAEALLEELPLDFELPRDTLNFLQNAAKGTNQDAPLADILTDLQKQMEGNLAAEVKSDQNNTANQKALQKEFKEQLKLLKSNEIKTQATKATVQTAISDDTQLSHETESQRKADMAFLNQSEVTCGERRSEYATRQKLRQQELDGVQKALDVLMRDDNRALLARAASFLQTDSESLTRASQALAVLQNAASTSQNYRLAALVLNLRRALPDGGLATVQKSLKDMISTLKNEAKSDGEKKDYCKKEYHGIKSEVGRVSFLIQKNQATISEIDNRVNELTAQKAAAKASIDAQTKQIQQLEKIRKQERNVYLTDKADDESAIKVLNETQGVLAKYYLQQSASKDAAVKVALLAVDPNDLLSAEKRALARSEENYQLSSGASQQGAANVVLATIAHISDGLKKEILEATVAENTAQHELDIAVNSSNLIVSDLEQKMISLQSQIEKQKEEQGSEQKALGSNQGQIDFQKTYETGLKAECDWIIANFDERSRKRDLEMQSLERATQLLSGSIYLQFDETLDIGERQLRGVRRH